MSTCPLCEMKKERILWENALCRVIWVTDDPRVAAFCRVILTEHKAEMTDLEASDRERLIRVVLAAESAIKETVRPDKINLASLGNQVPHLHWHIVGRFQDDAYFPDSIWSSPHHSRDYPRVSTWADDVRTYLNHCLRDL